MKATCDYCGRNISKSPVTVKRYVHSFCDRTCYWKFRREKWIYPRKSQKQSLFHRLIQRFGGASNEIKENQKVSCKGIQRPIDNTRTTNSTNENH
jgi:hypothetical protein